MDFIKKEYKNFSKKNYNSFILGCDVGGTNTNIGIFGVKNKMPVLLLSFHFKSNELIGLHYAVNETLNYLQKNHKIKITKACFAVAGVVSPDRSRAKATNIRWDASKRVLMKKSKLTKVLILNDFEAIGHGINMLSKKDVIAIKKGKKIPKAPILVIGAGTGLGKTTLVYNEYRYMYWPMHSEAGHSDFPAQSKFELDLVDFIKDYKKTKQVSYELVLSGQGISNIYMFLRRIKRFNETRYTKEIGKSNNNPELISKYRKNDNTCKAVFEEFKKIYARFAKNMALDGLAYGGVYIAGGIAPKNRDIFDREFLKLFEESHQMKHVLKRIPVYLILNYDVGLLGSGFAASRLLK